MLSTSIPRACQKLTACRPNIGGIRWFHNHITAKPKTVAAAEAISGFRPALLKAEKDQDYDIRNQAYDVLQKLDPKAGGQGPR